MRDITLSVVSHRQNSLVNQLLEDVQRRCADRVALVLTENIPDPTPLATSTLSCPVQRIANDKVKGFGANHNAAFKHCRTPYFCVANPDIRLPSDPFPQLLRNFSNPLVAVVGPLVRNPDGAAEDSARNFPTVGRLLQKLFVRSSGPDYPTDQAPMVVDWVAGMFMVFRSHDFLNVAGFDERYFLYYEDVDLCRRLDALGKRVLYDPGAAVVHDARRGSRRNLALMRRHLASMVRYLLS